MDDARMARLQVHPCAVQSRSVVDVHNRGQKSRPWSKFLFRVPPSLCANPEAHEPHLFHLSPYTLRFFHPPSHLLYDDAHCIDIDNPPHPDDWYFKEIMAKDLFGDAAFNSLVSKISEGTLLEQIKDMYHDIPRNRMDLFGKENLARLFAYSAVVIVGSVIFHPSFDGVPQGVSKNDMPTITPPSPIPYPVIYRRHALEDAVIVMENQIPIRLLQLACEVLCNPNCSPCQIEFEENHILMVSFRDKAEPAIVGLENAEEEKLAAATTRLLVYVLRMYLLLVDPFPDSLWNKEDLQETKNWIENHSLKPLIAYIYYCLVAPQKRKEARHRYRSRTLDACGYLPRIPATSKKSDHMLWRGRMLTASQLEMRGVKFLPQRDRYNGIHYDPMTMELHLPIMNINDRTLRFLRNVMTYELTSTMDENPVCSYVLFLDYLVDNDKDIEVLVKAKVLGNHIARSNVNVAELIDGLTKSISVDLIPEHRCIVEMLLRSRKGQLWLWWSLFKERFWEKQPWLVFSVVAAILLLVMTVLQTFRK